MGVRPEHQQLSQTGISAKLGAREMMGSSVHVHVTALARDVVAVVSGMDDAGHFMNTIPTARETHLSFHGNAVHLFGLDSQRNLEWPEKHAAEEDVRIPVENSQNPSEILTNKTKTQKLFAFSKKVTK